MKAVTYSQIRFASRIFLGMGNFQGPYWVLRTWLQEGEKDEAEV